MIRVVIWYKVHTSVFAVLVPVYRVLRSPASKMAKLDSLEEFVKEKIEQERVTYLQLS